MALSADALQYSADELRRQYGSLNPRGRVFRNQLLAPPPLAVRIGTGVNVGWGGSSGHLEDVAEIAPALMRFVLATPGVTLYEMPFAHAALAMQRLGARKEADEFERLAQSMAEAVAPGVPS